MPSQIKVDEIKNVAGQYKIKTDTFDGQTTAGSINVQGEGTNTTNLQQGLNKHWCNYNADGSSVNDSFNNSSMSDYATCNYGYNFTNNMGNNDYCPSGFIRDGSDNTHLRCVQSIDSSNFTTSVITIRPGGVNASEYLTNFDPLDVTLQIVGDLA